MDKQALLDILQGIKSNLVTGVAKESAQTQRLIRQIDQLVQEYQPLDLQNEELLEGLLKKGNTVKKLLRKQPDRTTLQEVKSYLKYVSAATYDFQKNISGLNYYIRSYLITAMLFMALSPQYFGFMLPAVFVVPIYLGLRGVKQRSRIGLIISLSMLPLGILTGILWVRYGLYALGHFDQLVQQIAQTLNRPVGMAQALVIIPSILGVVLTIAAVGTGYFGYKYRKMFV